MNTPEDELPSAVRRAYFNKRHIVISRLSGGIINRTYLVRSGGGSYILQQLNSLFAENTVLDFSAVSHHLAQRGWEVQRVMPTIEGKLCIRDEQNKLWRLLTFIDANDAPESMTTAQLYAVGKLLAELHRDLQSLHYRPIFSIPHFHETTFYANQLLKVAQQLPKEFIELTADCLMAYRRHALPRALSQLIHGDPRTTNILFRASLPLCYIDFDTLMVATPWIDIGDLLRSVNGNKDQTMPQFSLERSRVIAAGYYAANPLRSSFDAFFRDALESMSVICIELTMRFLTDIVDDCYFGWDSTNFSSRRENNSARAMAQWAIYEEASRTLGLNRS